MDHWSLVLRHNIICNLNNMLIKNASFNFPDTTVNSLECSSTYYSNCNYKCSRICQSLLTLAVNSNWLCLLYKQFHKGKKQPLIKSTSKRHNWVFTSSIRQYASYWQSWRMWPIKPRHHKEFFTSALWAVYYILTELMIEVHNLQNPDMIRINYGLCLTPITHSFSSRLVWQYSI